MDNRSRTAIPLVISGMVLAACGSAPASTAGPVSNAACTSPIASKSWYMQSELVGYEDPQNHLSISFSTYNPFKSLGSVAKVDAYFDVSGGSYSFPPDVQQTAPGIFSLAFSGTGRFTGSNFGRAATVDLNGSVDENTGAGDLTLKAEGSVFHLVVPATDTSGAVALSDTDRGRYRVQELVRRVPSAQPQSQKHGHLPGGSREGYECHLPARLQRLPLGSWPVRVGTGAP
jgi:hypothetical protein